MIERGGRVKVLAVPNRQQQTLLPITGSNIIVGSTVHTNEYKGYGCLSDLGYKHDRVGHSRYQWKDWKK